MRIVGSIMAALLCAAGPVWADPVTIKINESVYAYDSAAMVVQSITRIDVLEGIGIDDIVSQPAAFVDQSELSTVYDTVYLQVLPIVEISVGEDVTLNDLTGLQPSFLIDVRESVGVSDGGEIYAPSVVRILVEEAVGVQDTNSPLPAAMIQTNESIAVSDFNSVDPLPLVHINVSEDVRLTDDPGLLPSAYISVDEAVAVSEIPGVVAYPVVHIDIDEAIGIQERNNPLPAVMIQTNESIAVSDFNSVDPLPLVHINVSEDVRLTDDPGLLPSAYISVDEAVAVSEIPGVVAYPVVHIDVGEAVGVHDGISVLASAMIQVNEHVQVLDSFLIAPLPVIDIRVSEGVSILDGPSATASVRMHLPETILIQEGISFNMILPVNIDVEEYIAVRDITETLPAVFIVVAEGIQIADLVSSDFDDDGDGFGNSQEETAGSDPLNPDSIPGETQLLLVPGLNMVNFPAEIMYYGDLKTLLEGLGKEIVISNIFIPSSSGHLEEAGYKADGSFYGINHILGASQGIPGILIYARVPAEYNFESIYCHTWSLKPGLNLVGSPCLPEMETAFNLLARLGGASFVSSIQKFDLASGAFVTAAFDTSGNPTGMDFRFEKDKAYFIYMKQAIPSFRP